MYALCVCVCTHTCMCLWISEMNDNDTGVEREELVLLCYYKAPHYLRSGMVLIESGLI